MLPNRSDTVRLWTDLLVEELVRCGVELVVMAPGSRSTPLVAACVRHPRMRLQSHLDERGAAFMALGYARATGRPAVWLTTSGTAVANGLPAVVEASTDGVPLLLITADRPPELRDTAANQTIAQPFIFGSYVRWQADLPVPDSDIDPAYVLTTVDQAVYRSQGSRPGPVHLNAMFRKPLEPAQDAVDVRGLEGLAAWVDRTTPFTEYARATVDSDVSSLVDALRNAERPMIVAGRLSRAEADGVRHLSRATGWPVAADILSQLRLGHGLALSHTSLIAAHVDALPMPDAVIQVGRPGVSRPLSRALAAAGPAVRAVVADGPGRIDPEHRATHRLQGTGAVLAKLAESFPGRGHPWHEPWEAADLRVAQGLGNWFRDGELTEPAVAWHLSGLVQEDHGLFVSSSMPVRDLDSFAGRGARPVVVSANRGASGIDGTVASAVGLSEGLGAPVTLLLGDLALLHDLNALALLKDREVTVVVLNNDGGGIFSFLPIAEHRDVFDPWLSAPHGMTFGPAAEQFGLAYRSPADAAGFRAAYQDAIRSGSSSLIEIRTDREDNRRLHTDLVDAAGRWVMGS